MRVIYPQSMQKEATRARRQHEKNSTKKREVIGSETAPSLISVQNAPIWDDLNIEAAAKHVGPFLNFIKNTHDERFPVFTSALVSALEESDASPERAMEILRESGSIMTFTDLLALLGPAVKYALSLALDKERRTPENIEKFVISLVLALAEATNKFSGNEKLLPLDDDLLASITVTVRNIMYAYRNEFDKIDYGSQLSIIQKLFSNCCGKK